MKKQDKAVNAGVHNATGIEFQKHCALLFIFQDYENFADADFFITIENHDDVVFCFRDADKKIEKISAYQLKKASTSWSLGTDLIEIIKKLLLTGTMLLQDNFNHSDIYTHSLSFGTNNSITLNNGKRKKDAIYCTINEANNQVQFSSLDKEISANLIKKLSPIDPTMHKELENLNLFYIDFPKTSAQQLKCLIGECANLFGDKIADHQAAVESILKLFRNIETTYNQGNISCIDDKSKRVEGYIIREAFNIVTKETRAFDMWRSKKSEMCGALQIALTERCSFESYFESSFDLFKDITQSEYQKVLKFVKDNKLLWGKHYSEIDLIQELFSLFKCHHDTFLSDLELKAVLFAAYVEVEALYE